MTGKAPKRPQKPRAAAGARSRALKERAADKAKLPATGDGLRPSTALLAAGGVLAGGLALLLATGGRAHALENGLGATLAHEAAAAGFSVKSVEIEGASRFSIPYILAAAGVERGAPILGLDLDQMRERVEKVGWVKSVRILRLLPDTVVIAVAERPRLAVWQSGGQTRVVDPDGQIIPEADPGLFVDLPLIVGDGANEAAAAILPELQSRPRLMSRMEALVRVDGRRWDIRLKDGALIQLPAVQEDSALIQLDELDQKDRLLDLGFERIDLRDPEMIAVKPRQAPAASGAAATTQASAGAAPPSPAPQTSATASAGLRTTTGE